MASCGHGDIAARVISKTGPRALRRKIDADPAIVARIQAGAIVEVMARPRTFQVAGIGAEHASSFDRASFDEVREPGAPSVRPSVMHHPDLDEIWADLLRDYGDRRGSMTGATALCETASAY